MKNFEAIETFINTHDDWRDLLKRAPYNLKHVTRAPFDKNWYILMYNLFESDLSNDIVRQCRGTIVDADTKRVICAPYTKFFNYGEKYAHDIDWNTAIVTEKMDGNLIKLFKHDDNMYIVTNGGWDVNSLASSSANVNYDTLIRKLIDVDDICNKVENGDTLMFELCTMYNTIICEYDDCKMWFHGFRDAHGVEHDVRDVNERLQLNLLTPRVFDLNNIIDVNEMLETWNGHIHEGVVIRDAQFNRIKIKCDDYLALKFSKHVTSPRRLFHIWKTDEYDDAPAGLRETFDEFESNIDKICDVLKTWYDDVYVPRKHFDKNEYIKIIRTYDKRMFSYLASFYGRTFDEYVTNFKKYMMYSRYKESLKLLA